MSNSIFQAHYQEPNPRKGPDKIKHGWVGRGVGVPLFEFKYTISSISSLFEIHRIYWIPQAMNLRKLVIDHKIGKAKPAEDSGTGAGLAASLSVGVTGSLSNRGQWGPWRLIGFRYWEGLQAFSHPLDVR